MNISDRIQSLRKINGISQEALADRLGVSRQAVSKWESEQSLPDLEKIILMSEFFDVTTDYILKGIEPAKTLNAANPALTGKILYIASTTFIAMGLFFAFAGWYEEQSVSNIWGSMIIQALGVAGYFIAGLFPGGKPSLWVMLANMALLLFMPVSMITSMFVWGWPMPYPIHLNGIVVFLFCYIPTVLVCGYLIKKRFTRS